jgi:hypothetical protein
MNQAPSSHQQKPPTPSAIEKALRVLTSLYRVTLEPLPKASVGYVEGREAKKIVL